MQNIKKHKALVIIGVLVIFVGAIIYAKQSNPANELPSMILFYSTSCPHCKIVEAYITDNGVRNKLKFQELEVSSNQANADLLGQKAQKCKLDTNKGIGVPFFFDGEKCIVGDQDIISYFKTK